MANTNPLQRVLYWLTPVDPLLAYVACEAILCTGSPGSGKSSTAMMQIIRAFLAAGYGGMFLSAKAEDTKTYIDYVKDAGREADLIVFGPDSEHCFDPIYYLWNRPGRGAGMLETLVDFFMVLMAVGSPHEGKSNQPFWERKAQQLMRAAIVLLHLAGEAISIRSIDDIIADFPAYPGQHETLEWQTARCGEAVFKIRERKESLTPSQYNDFGRALHFVCVEWAALHTEVRGSIHAEWSGLADKFLYEPFLSKFSGKCTFLPEDITQANKIVIIDFPILEGGDAFRIGTNLCKLSFQHGILRKDVTKYPTPSFLVADECQLTILPKGRDERFLQVARSARCCTLLASQNLVQLAAEFGESDLGPKTKGWLANIGTRIAMQQIDPDSNQATADVIGKIYRPIEGSSYGNNQASLSSKPELAHRFLPADFSTLKKPSVTDPFAEAVVFSGGRRFKASRTTQNPEGDPYVVTRFSRNS